MSMILNALAQMMQQKQPGARAAQEPGTPDAWDRQYAQMMDKSLPIPPGAEFVKRTKQQAEYPAEALKSSAAIGKPTPAFDGVPKDEGQIPAVSPLQSGPIFAQPVDAPLPRPVMTPISLKNPTGEASPYAEAMAANRDYWKNIGQAETGVPGADALEDIMQRRFNPSNGFMGVPNLRDRFMLAQREQGQQAGSLSQAIQDATRSNNFETQQANQLKMSEADNLSREKIAGMHYTPDAIKSRTRDSVMGAMMAQGKGIEEIANAMDKVDLLNTAGGTASVAGQPAAGSGAVGQPAGSAGGTSVDPLAAKAEKVKRDDQVAAMVSAASRHMGDEKTPVNWNREASDAMLDSLSGFEGLPPESQSAIVSQLMKKSGNSKAFMESLVKSGAKSALITGTNQGLPFDLTNQGDSALDKGFRALMQWRTNAPTFSRAVVDGKHIPLGVDDVSSGYSPFTSQSTQQADLSNNRVRLNRANAIIRELQKMGAFR